MKVKATSLWSIGLAPMLWSLHMMATYITSSVWCAKMGRPADLEFVRWLIIFYTIIAIIPVFIHMFKSYRKHRHGNATLPHNEGTDEDRERFLGFANFLISSLSAIGILFIGFNAFIFRSCH